jgi:hypothetical protein
MKKEIKIAIFSLATIGVAVGGYFAYKHFFKKKGVVTATSKKDRNVIIENKK